MLFSVQKISAFVTSSLCPIVVTGLTFNVSIIEDVVSVKEGTFVAVIATVLQMMRKALLHVLLRNSCFKFRQVRVVGAPGSDACVQRFACDQ